MTTRQTLVKVETTKARAFRSGRREVWAAVTVDGEWAFHRLEMTGTPWTVTHVPSMSEVAWLGTLKACRQYVTQGLAAADLEKEIAQ